MLNAFKNLLGLNSLQETELLSVVAQKTDNAVIITDSLGQILWSNDAFEKISGYTLAEVKGKKPGTFLQGPDTDQETVKKIRTSINEAKAFKEDILNYHKNGKPYWIQLHVTPVFNEKNQIDKFIAFELDITDKKLQDQHLNRLLIEIQSKNEEMLAAEEELRQNMEELEAIQDQLKYMNAEQEIRLTLINKSMGYIEFDPNGTVLTVNDYFAKLMGYEIAELVGINHKNFIRQEERNTEEYQNHWKKLRAGEILDGSFERIAKNGEIKHLRAFYAPLKDKNNQVIRVIKLAFDTTESFHQQMLLKQQQEEMLAAEEELRQNMEELEAIQDQLKFINAEQEARLTLINKTMGMIEFDPYGVVLNVNENFAKLMGYTVSEMKGEKHVNFVKEDERESSAYINHWNRLRAGEILEGEFERVSKNGDIKYLRAFYAPVKDKNSQIVRVIKFAFDNTEIRIQAINLQKANQLLTEKEDKLRQLALVAAKTDNAVIITSSTGSIEWVNPGFTHLTGYTLEDVQGKKPGSFLQGPLTNQDTVSRIREQLKTKQSFREEIVNYSKDGKAYWLSLAITPILNEFGEIVQFIAIESDITAQKEKNLELSEKNKEIQDSITYAQRIQKALLSPSTEVKKYLSDTFLLNKPKDKLSGDFTWFGESNGMLYVAVADCTGHGVPGAMMSVLGVTLLNQILNQNPSALPAEILLNLSSSLRAALLADSEMTTIQDGMDIALIRINPQTGELIFSGAHRSIIVVQNQTFIELDGDKQCIGVDILENQPVNFTNQDLKLSKGDRVYLFSDGITDQFGGRENKKITSKKFLFFLKTIQDQAIAKQKEEIAYFVEQWKGNLEQTDDILVLGLEL